MKNDMEINKQYWDKVGGNYDDNWKNFAKSKLSKKEINFILKHLTNNCKETILDIGSGNGRIIKNYLQSNSNNIKESEIIGVDISDSMILVCREKFKNCQNVKIKKCDISKEEIPTDSEFSFVSAIRVLKYNSNWRDILKKVSQRMKKGGTFVFTAVNNNSADRFSIYPIKIHKSNIKEIKNILRDNRLDIIEITSFSKIPDIFYNTVGKSLILSNFLSVVEFFLELIFGKLFLGRIFYIACRKI